MLAEEGRELVVAEAARSVAIDGGEGEEKGLIVLLEMLG